MDILNYQLDHQRRIARNLKIIKDYGQELMLVKEIAEKYGVSERTVKRVARLAGLPKRPRAFPENVRKAVLEAYIAGLPVAEIAEKNEVSPAYVSKLATSEGINRRDFSVSQNLKASRQRD